MPRYQISGKKSVKWKLNEIKYNKKNEETSLASTCILPFRLFSLCWLYESSLLWVGLSRLITIKTPINPVKLTRKSKILVWQLWRWCHVIDAFSFAGLVITKLEAPIFMVLQSISYLSMDLNIVVILKKSPVISCPRMGRIDWKKCRAARVRWKYLLAFYLHSKTLWENLVNIYKIMEWTRTDQSKTKEN